MYVQGQCVAFYRHKLKAGTHLAMGIEGTVVSGAVKISSFIRYGYSFLF